jgi:tRNA(His) 5'-end guanylyltransferase
MIIIYYDIDESSKKYMEKAKDFILSFSYRDVLLRHVNIPKDGYISDALSLLGRVMYSKRYDKLEFVSGSLNTSDYFDELENHIDTKQNTVTLEVYFKNIQQSHHVIAIYRKDDNVPRDISEVSTMSFLMS